MVSHMLCDDPLSKFSLPACSLLLLDLGIQPPPSHNFPKEFKLLISSWMMVDHGGKREEDKEMKENGAN